MTRIDEIRERAEKATKGPWEWSGRKEDADGFIYHPQGSYLADTLILLGDTYEDDHLDLDFIAHSREDIPYLLNRIKELEGLLGEAKTVYYPVREMRNGTILYAKKKFTLCNCDGSLHEEGIGCD